MGKKKLTPGRRRKICTLLGYPNKNFRPQQGENKSLLRFPSIMFRPPQPEEIFLYLVPQTKLSARRRREIFFITWFPKQSFPPAAGGRYSLLGFPNRIVLPPQEEIIFTWFPKQNIPPAVPRKGCLGRHAKKSPIQGFRKSREPLTFLSTFF